MITFLTEDEEDRAPFLERAVLHFNMLDEKKAKENKVKEAAMAVKGMEYMTKAIHQTIHQPRQGALLHFTHCLPGCCTFIIFYSLPK